MEFMLEDADAQAVEQLDDLLVELHRHESEVSPALGTAAARPNTEYVQLYRSRFAEWFSGGDGFLILARELVEGSADGPVVGFVFAVERQGDTAYDTGERIGYVEEIAVLERARGGGVGRALIEETRRRFERRGIEFIKLSTVPGNDAARAFYETLGFTTAAVLLIGRSGD